MTNQTTQEHGTFQERLKAAQRRIKDGKVGKHIAPVRPNWGTPVRSK